MLRKKQEKEEMETEEQERKQTRLLQNLSESHIGIVVVFVRRQSLYSENRVRF